MTTKLNWLLLCFTAIFAFYFTSCKDDEEEYSADYLLAIAEEDMNISVDAETTSYEIELTARAIWKATVTKLLSRQAMKTGGSHWKMTEIPEALTH